MTREQLQQVKDFEIWNEDGKISYFREVDLTGVDLAKDVSIFKTMIEMYPDESEKPAFGQKLNHPAFVTLFNVKPKQNESVEQCQARLRNSISKNGGEFISYDGSKWEFKVPSM